MSYRYALHPQELAVNESERLYTKMAAKGWHLVKRGVFLSCFQRAEPREMQYRIVVVMSAASEGPPFSAEQMAVYENSGWEFITGQGFIYVFRTPQNSGASELCLAPDQQEETIKKLKKRYINSLLQIPLSLFLFLLLGALLSNAGGMRHFTASIYRGWVEDTAGAICLLLFFLWFLFKDLCSIWYLKQLCIKIKAGLPADRPRSRSMYLQFFNRILFLAILISGILAVGQWGGSSNHEMPLQSDGPYLVLSDIGVKGVRTQSFIKNRTSRVVFEQSLLSGHWNTYEVVDVTGNEVWMQQDVYHLKNSDMTARLVDSLMKDGVFTDSIEDFTEVDITGLDHAWISEQLECIAVKGDYVCFVTYPDHGREELISILQAVAKKWA